MDYPCGKFGDCSFSCFGSIVGTNRQTHTDADERFTPTTLVGVSKWPIYALHCLRKIVTSLKLKLLLRHLRH